MPRGRPKKVITVADVLVTPIVEKKKVKEVINIDTKIDKVSKLVKPIQSKKDNIDSILDSLSKKYRLVVGNNVERKDKLSTGSFILNNLLDGGFIRGKIIEVFGLESLGKTALAYQLMAQATGTCAYIDCESCYDKETAKMYGVDTSKVIVGEPEYIEQGMEMTMDFVKAGVEIVVFDSIAGIGPKVELEGSMEDSNIGKKASRMGQLMRRLHGQANDKGTIIYFINQIRQNVGNPYDPVTTPGGNALKFQASYRLYLTGKEKIKKSGEDSPIGHYIKVTLKKNKFGPPDLKAQVPLIYGYGISKEWEILDIAIEKGVIVKSGSWLSYEGTNLAQGQLNTMLMLIDNPELYEEIKAKL